MLQWLANYSIKTACFETTVNFLCHLKYTESMHDSVLRQICNVTNL